MTPKEFTAEIAIDAMPEEIWLALVDPERVAQYHLASLRVIELENNGQIIYGTADRDMITGRILEARPCEKLVHTFRFAPNHAGTKADPETVVSYEIRKDNDGAILILRHSGFREENQTYANIAGGWPYILENLKSFLEEK